MSFHHSAARLRASASSPFSPSSVLLASSSSTNNMFASSVSTSGKDIFLRDTTASQRFIKKFRTLPFPARMTALFGFGFAIGAVIEVFACKTHLYESVMSKKDTRRHDFDEFVDGFRTNVERWQKEDMKRAAN